MDAGLLVRIPSRDGTRRPAAYARQLARRHHAVHGAPCERHVWLEILVESVQPFDVKVEPEKVKLWKRWNPTMKRMA